jgi:4-alpha-glucanotransferase
MPTPVRLQTLARLYNLQTVYQDGLGHLRNPPPEAILSVLKSLGAALESLDDVPGALRARHQELWQRAIEPVTVAWQGQPLKVKLRLPMRFAQLAITGEILLENGERIEGEFDEWNITRPLLKQVEGARYVVRTLVRREPIPLGYHRIVLRAGDLNLESYLFVAPYVAYRQRPPGARRWGVFCPLYAIHSKDSWGAGDISDLAELAQWVGEMEGHAVATLPMLPAFLDEPFDPSPYAPISRLYWNELYLDVAKIPEVVSCPAAQALLNSSELRREIDAACERPLIDYRKVMALKRKVIEAAIDHFFASRRRAEFENFVAARPGLQGYAAFRAKCERERKSWLHWPEAERNGVLAPGSYDGRAQSYHLYVQWLCHEQAQWLRKANKKDGTGPYLDFPVGVNRDGYDVWRERELFAINASGGAPPDALFVKGQNWGFPPCHPGATRRHGYRYYRECLRHHMAYAAMLRIDHVMGLHRSYWVPEGFSAADGLYVHNHAAEYYAVLNLESHRHQVQIIGENLGTVPPYVNEALVRHQILGMHVGQFSVSADPSNAVVEPPSDTVTSLNTHDTATFMSFWTGAEIDDRLALGLLTPEQADQEHGYRSAQRDALIAYLRSVGRLGDDAGAAAVLRGWLAFLAAGGEEFLLINLEDLWLETQPQNVPGTWQERPNWQRKARYSLDQIRAMPELVALLKAIRDIRRRMG